MPRGQPGVPVKAPETRLLSEWIAARHPNDRVQLQPRLGAITPEMSDAGLSSAELAMLGVWRRYPDAILFYSSSVTIVECCLKPDPGKIGVLKVYRHLFPLTPEFADFKSYRIDLLVVWAVNDLAAEAVARMDGISVEVFAPPWITEYLSWLRPRDRRAARLPS